MEWIQDKIVDIIVAIGLFVGAVVGFLIKVSGINIRQTNMEKSIEKVEGELQVLANKFEAHENDPDGAHILCREHKVLLKSIKESVDEIKSSVGTLDQRVFEAIIKARNSDRKI
jgi:hypothetical protein